MTKIILVGDKTAMGGRMEGHLNALLGGDSTPQLHNHTLAGLEAMNDIAERANENNPATVVIQAEMPILPSQDSYYPPRVAFKQSSAHESGLKILQYSHLRPKPGVMIYLLTDQPGIELTHEERELVTGIITTYVPPNVSLLHDDVFYGLNFIEPHYVAA